MYQRVIVLSYGICTAHSTISTGAPDRVADNIVGISYDIGLPHTKVNCSKPIQPMHRHTGGWLDTHLHTGPKILTSSTNLGGRNYSTFLCYSGNIWKYEAKQTYIHIEKIIRTSKQSALTSWQCNTSGNHHQSATYGYLSLKQFVHLLIISHRISSLLATNVSALREHSLVLREN